MSQGGRPSPIRAGLACRCPACGNGPLFDGYLTVAGACETCGQSFAEADSGDGPAVFVILILGFFVVFAALFVELRYAPPVWVHAVIWVPVVIAGSLILVRIFKSLLIALQFHHRAGEGRTGEDG